MMTYRIEQEAFEPFFQCPFEVYPSDTKFVSPMKTDLRRWLDPKVNPLFREFGTRTFFTLHEGNRVVGRIVAHVHTSANQRHDLSRSYFGFFDCINDPEATALLLSAAEDWGRKQGCSEIAGNFNLTAMQQVGVITAGFEAAPYTDQLWSPAHLYPLLEAQGYQRFFPMTTFEVDLRELDPRSLLGSHGAEALQDPRNHIEPARRRHVSRLMDQACDLLNAGFHANPMFVPLTHTEFRFQAKDMAWIMDPQVTLVAYRDGEPVGLVICIPDVNPLLRAIRSRTGWNTPYHYVRNRMLRERAVLIFASTTPACQNTGISSAILSEVTRRLRERGYQSLGITWVADENRASLRLVEKMDGKALHRLHLYRKSLVVG